MLKREFYLQNCITLAKNLLGKLLVYHSPKGKISGIITETESYLGVEDKASKAYKGVESPGNYPMFKIGGTSFVYLTYGIHELFNVVAMEENNPAAVLIRSVLIVEGKETASQNRYSESYENLTEAQIMNISNGPGKLTKAYGIDRKLNMHDLTKKPLYICDYITPFEIEIDRRIGIDYAEEAIDFPFRFYIKGQSKKNVRKVKNR